MSTLRRPCVPGVKEHLNRLREKHPVQIVSAPNESALY